MNIYTNTIEKVSDTHKALLSCAGLTLKPSSVPEDFVSPRQMSLACAGMTAIVAFKAVTVINAPPDVVIMATLTPTAVHLWTREFGDAPWEYLGGAATAADGMRFHAPGNGTDVWQNGLEGSTLKYIHEKLWELYNE